MNFYENLVELDLNPIISFSSNGKILYSNSEAQFVLNRVNKKELFEIAVKNASTTYGTKTTYLNLNLKTYSFYAITVSYENEDELILKLYKSISMKKENRISQNNAKLTNVFTLVDLCISNSKTKSSAIFAKNYDPSIPEFKIVISELIKLLSSVYKDFVNEKKIDTVVRLKIGEYIIIEKIKYNLVSIVITSQNEVNTTEIKEDNYNSLIISKEDNKIIIDLPLITS